MMIVIPTKKEGIYTASALPDNYPVPDDGYEVPAELETKVLQSMSFFTITVVDGRLTDVEAVQLPAVQSADFPLPISDTQRLAAIEAAILELAGEICG